MHYKLYLHHRTTYKYMPFLEVPRQLCSTPQSKDTQTPHSVYCCCWQDKEGRCHSVLDTSQGHNLPRGGRYNKSERKTDRQTDNIQTDDVPTHERPSELDWNPEPHTHLLQIFKLQTPFCEHMNLGPVPLSGCAFSTHAPTTWTSVLAPMIGAIVSERVIKPEATAGHT